MEYLISILKENERIIVSRHNSKQEALEAGKKAWEDSEKGITVSCISGEVDDEGKLIGKYRLYESWF